MVYNFKLSDDEFIENLNKKASGFSDIEKYDLLVTAIYEERFKLLKFLLKSDIFVYSIDGSTSIYEHCVFRQNFKAFDLINRYKPVTMFRDDSSLNIAVMYNLPLKRIKKLYKCGCSLNVVDYRSMTCVDWAIQQKNNTILRFLLENGAKILHQEEQHCLSVAVSDNNLEAVKLLLKFGVDLNEPRDLPLMLALQSGFYEMADFLLENGADINKKDTEGNTALFYTAVKDDKAGLFFLLKRGADEYLSSNGITLVKLLNDSSLREKLYSYWYE